MDQPQGSAAAAVAVAQHQRSMFISADFGAKGGIHTVGHETVSKSSPVSMILFIGILIEATWLALCGRAISKHTEPAFGGKILKLFSFFIQLFPGDLQAENGSTQKRQPAPRSCFVPFVCLVRTTTILSLPFDAVTLVGCVSGWDDGVSVCSERQQDRLCFCYARRDLTRTERA